MPRETAGTRRHETKKATIEIEASSLLATSVSVAEPDLVPPRSVTHLDSMVLSNWGSGMPSCSWSCSGSSASSPSSASSTRKTFPESSRMILPYPFGMGTDAAADDGVDDDELAMGCVSWSNVVASFRSDPPDASGFKVCTRPRAA